MTLFDEYSEPPWEAELVAGVDEVGRGPLAGPVVAGAVILNRRHPVEGLKDSKRLTPKCREELSREIRKSALAWALGRAEVEEVDRLNVLHASLLAMARAVAALGVRPRIVYVDGNRLPTLAVPAVAVVGGDDVVPQISAAAIIAKTARDTEMIALAQTYPGYGFERHKGYPTRQHLNALARLGPCAAHRTSFAPVREALAARGENPASHGDRRDARLARREERAYPADLSDEQRSQAGWTGGGMQSDFRHGLPEETL